MPGWLWPLNTEETPAAWITEGPDAGGTMTACSGM
jgi:hypothetical protein